jgi:hypothetical protein
MAHGPGHVEARNTPAAFAGAPYMVKKQMLTECLLRIPFTIFINVPAVSGPSVWLVRFASMIYPRESSGATFGPELAVDYSRRTARLSPGVWVESLGPPVRLLLNPYLGSTSLHGVEGGRCF